MQPGAFSDIAILLPAAGASRRLGQPKQLVELDGRPLIARAVDIAASICACTVCVLGSKAEQISAVLPATPGLTVVSNADWRLGMGHSIARGVLSLFPRAPSAVLIWPPDQWRIDRDALTGLLAHWRQHPDAIIASRYENIVGAPAVFPARFFSQLTGLTGDRGARSLLQQHAAATIARDLPQAAFDLDTAADLAQLRGSAGDQR